MKSFLKYTCLLFVFGGFLVSYFQLTLTQVSKKCGLSFIENTFNDVEDSEDDTEDDSETKKIEIEEDFLITQFNHTFYKEANSKTKLRIKQAKITLAPVIAINAPPPQV